PHFLFLELLLVGSSHSSLARPLDFVRLRELESPQAYKLGLPGKTSRHVETWLTFTREYERRAGFMEGPNLRSFPRTFFCCPVEFSVGDKIICRKQAQGNLSVHGLFLQAEVLPVDSAVHIKIGATRSVEVDGVVRFCGSGGVGIQFTAALKAD